MSYWKIDGKVLRCSNCSVAAREGYITPYCPFCGHTMDNYKDRLCDAYHIENGVPVCWGTKEREYCSCEGHKNKCNFY